MPHKFEYDTSTRFEAGQDTRFPGALDSAFVGIDERSELDLMSEVVDVSQIINFYDETNTPNGAWMPFLLKDDRWTYAWILSRDCLAKKTRVSYILKAAKARAPKALGDSIVGIIETIVEIFLDVDLWSQNRRSVFNIPESRFDRFVESSMDKELKECFHRLCDTVSLIGIDEFDLSRKADESIKHCLKIWSYQPSRGDKIDPEEAIARLAKVFNDSYEVYVSIVELAREEYYRNIYTGETSPDIAMLAAFIRLYERQRKQINTITQRHLDFQYKELLGFSEKHRTPDEVYVVFELSEQLKRSVVPEGALLGAGNDENGENILFETVGETPLNHARIGDAFTLFHDSGEGGTGLIYYGELAGLDRGLSDPDRVEQPWTAFGTSEEVSNETLVNREAAFAWSLSSPALHLEGGSRTVKLSLTFDEESRGAFKRLAERSENDRFLGMEYRISGENGWIAIEPKEAWNGEAIEVTLQLDRDVPPIIATEWLSLEFGGDQDAVQRWPMLHMKLGSDEAPHVYPTLRDAKLTKIELEVSVDSLNISGFYHDSNPVANQMSSSLFSGVPTVGSTMAIGSREIFAKPLENLVLTIGWEDLPSEGFKSYYSTYNQCFAHHIEPHYIDNSSFKARFDLLKDKDWIPLKGGDETRLFEGDDSSRFRGLGACEAQTSFEFDFAPQSDLETEQSDKANSTDDDDLLVYEGDPLLLDEPLNFGENARKGFVRMVLSTPQIAFGHSKLSQVVNYVTTLNAKLAQEVGTKVLKWLMGTGIAAIFLWLYTLLDPEKKLQGQIIKLLKDHPGWAVVIAIALVGGYLIYEFFLKEKQEAIQAPNLPVTPKVKDIRASYRSRHITDFSRAEVSGSPVQLTQETPFSTIRVVEGKGSAMSLPMNDQPSGSISKEGGIRILPVIGKEGSLYLDVTNTQELDTLTFYWELIPDETQVIARAKADLEIEYLSKEGWKAIRNNLLEDATNGLMSAGLMRIVLPEDIAQDAQGMPHPGCWLAFRSQVENGNFSKVRSVALQAAKARRVVEGDSECPSHSIPAWSIEGLTKMNKDISSVFQPYPSFGGKRNEKKLEFYTRVSERLRHKNRAVTSWDFNRIILEKFNSICHVAIETAKDVDADCDVFAMIVPWYENSEQSGCFRPRSSPTFLHNVSEFIALRKSPFCRAKVVNPQFRVVRCVFDVVFSDASGAGRKIDELNQKLRRFLSPWIRSSESGLEIASTLRKADVLQFINGQENVELVLNFRFDGEKEDREILELDGNAELFVSADEHDINLLVESDR